MGLTLLVALGATVSGILWANSIRAIDLDESLCLKGAQPPTQTFILIDQTTTFTSDDIARARAAVFRERDRLGRHGRLVLISLEQAGASASREVFSRCSPGRFEEGNVFEEDPDMLQDRWTSDFSGILERELEGLLGERDSKQSPILGALRVIASRSDFRQTEEPSRIVLVSDLLENTHTFSMYRALSE